LCNPVLVEKEKERKWVNYLGDNPVFLCGSTSLSNHGLLLNRTLHSPTHKQNLSSCAWLYLISHNRWTELHVWRLQLLCTLIYSHYKEDLDIVTHTI